MKSNRRARCARICNALIAAYGEPKWAGPQDPLDVLVKMLLAQGASTASAEKAFAALRAAYPVWDQVADARPESVARAVHAGGLAPQKAKHVIKLIKDIKKEYGAASLEFIKTMSVREAMRALDAVDGVGQKTGACVILFALGREICPVDAHILRILQRVGIIPGTATAEQAFELLQPLVPSGRYYAFHVNLITLGRSVCKAGKPRCSACSVETECRYPLKTTLRR